MNGGDRWGMELQPQIMGTETTTLVAILCTIVAMLSGIRWLVARSPSNRKTNVPPQSCNVPFVALHDLASRNQQDTQPKSLDRLLRSVMEEYHHESSRALAGMSRMLEKALSAEATVNIQKSEKLLSRKLERRIRNTAACLEHNEQVLAALLGNFSYRLALPETHDNDSNYHTAITQTTGGSHHFRTQASSNPNTPILNASETHSYDSATQLWAHMVRDWTVEGRPIRKSLYDWCCQQLNAHAKLGSTVLVPGSGMGRLAFDLYQQGYHVEANELSVSMAVAASSVLQTKLSGSFYPYVLDAMANEVDSKRRFTSVQFPDVPIPTETAMGSLSYTVGDFVGGNDDYYRREKVGDFDAIVTCFFIDTATNIYEYLSIIHNLLRPRGVWINVGPVQWHHNALLRPSVDELKDLLEAFGWHIQSWRIDPTPISYRNDNPNEFQFPAMTSYDGYRPLRFVAIRN